MIKHILTIDDEEVICDMLSQALTALGYRVTCANAAREACRIVKEDPPQLIISDLQMEDTDGLELIEQLKEILPGVPVMLLTGMIFDPDVIEENINKKVSSYIEKTVPLHKITQEAQRLLGDWNTHTV
jgi:CheY-like chemotaxis protein